jgi:ADP-ribosylglycohydrolase
MVGLAVSIADKTGGDRSGRSGRQPSEQLAWFCDREPLVRRFLGYLHEGPRETILYVHGTGGNGKSLLLRFLQERCCWRAAPQTWRTMRDRSLEEILELGPRTSGAAVAAARLDFGARPQGEERPQESLSALFSVKRQLAGAGVRTPRFDFAALTYLHRTGGDYRARLPQLFPSSELQGAIDMAEALSALPVIGVGKALVSYLGQRTGDALFRKVFAKRVQPELVERVLELPAEPELIGLLPELFAQDLNAHRHDGPVDGRTVLFFDTHEAFWGAERFPPGRIVPLHVEARDQWLRRLLRTLEFERGIVCVVAGREPPFWDRTATDPIPGRFIDLCSLDGLEPADADRYLCLAGIDNGDLRARLIGHATGDDGRAHPYFLGLLADAANQAGQQGKRLADELEAEPSMELRERQLVARFMAWVPPEIHDAIVACAAARSFDRRSFDALGEARSFTASSATFDCVLGFSFVSRVSGEDATGDGRFQIHLLLRRALERLVPAEMRDAHRALLAHHQARALAGSFDDDVESIYHRAWLDPQSGVQRWIALARSCLQAGRFERLKRLARIWGDMRVAETSGREEALVLLARAMIGWGQPELAAELAEQLAPDSTWRAIVDSELAFARREFTAGRELIERALPEAAPEQAAGLRFRLASIELYAGNFSRAAALADAGLQATHQRNPQWLVLRGEIALFAGDLDRAQAAFEEVCSACDGDDGAGQGMALAGALSGLGLLLEARGQGANALGLYERVLTLRSDAEDVSGVAAAWHGIGKARLAAADPQAARNALSEGAAIARRLGDGLQLAKILHTEAESWAKQAAPARALEIITQVVKLFRAAATPFDIAHGLLTAARLHEAAGSLDAAADHLRGARAINRQQPFGLLEHLYPELTDEREAGVAAGLIAFAAGDALGAPWEGRPPGQLREAALSPIPRRDGWPRGATSDDTAQLLIIAEVMADNTKGDLQRRFLQRLSDAAPGMRGIGPSTTAAVERYRSDGTLIAQSGASNGAAMRALAIGWGAASADERRALARALTATTHGHPDAMAAAFAVAALADWALDARPLAVMIQAAAAEAARVEGADVSAIRQAADGTWTAPEHGVELNAIQTVAAVLHVLTHATSVADATQRAVRLGGDTDTVAAIAAGVLASHSAHRTDPLPFLDEVRLPPAEDITRLAEQLARRSERA